MKRRETRGEMRKKDQFWKKYNFKKYKIWGWGDTSESETCSNVKFHTLCSLEIFNSGIK